MRLAILGERTTRLPPHRRFVRVGPESISKSHQRRGLYRGEPEHCRRSLGQFLLVMLQLVLLLAVTKVYRLEGRAFELIMTIATVALPLHYLLPFRWKRPCFLGASALGLTVVFGWTTAIFVGVIGIAITTICLSSLQWRYKVLGVGSIALGLGICHAGFVTTPLPAPVIPIAGTLFMFRAIIFLYEIKHTEQREPITGVASYFMLLPNFCFLHFPVVDYRTMERSYLSAEIHETQRQGLKMILIGFVHLVLYRVVYHELVIPPSEVQGPSSLFRFLICNYLLYLHVSGQFHVACGLLHLFGFKLPETHHRYLLATGFTDYWRRINIYWKDFMVRLVFNPIAFRFKRRPVWQSLSIATGAVFLATWFLHAYQAFWLTGSWGFSWPDALFWGILGVLVMINVQLDARHGPRRRTSSRASQQFVGWSIGIRSLKVASTLLTITLLWSLWTSSSVTDWLAMIARGLMIAP